MRVKRYIVNAIPDALPMIRSELGNDAVILNTKQIRTGGFMGMFSKKKVEVLAAVESGIPASKAVPKPAPVRAPETEKEQPLPTVTAKTALSSYSASRKEEPATVASALTAAASAAPAPSVATTLSAMTALSNSAALLESKPAATSAVRKGLEVPDQDFMHELRDMMTLVRELTKQQAQDALPAVFKMLQSRLVQQEVSEDLISRLLDEVKSHVRYPETIDSAEVLWEVATGILLSWLTPLSGTGIVGTTSVVHFVGPTGVGKTTTIAKLAAEQVLKRGRTVGFVTSDTYRIAAVDQLRTYANILNVPLEVVFSPAEVNRAFKELEDRDLIFMDTAGRNYRSELYVSEVSSLLKGGHNTETLLVLSLTGKTKDMTDVAEQFSRYGVQKVLFTKLDETSVYGAILNLTIEKGLRPTYIGYGQTVPDDIEAFNAESYVKLLLGEYADE